MSEMVERVERVIAQFCARGDDQPGHYTECARAIIAAMREPTDNMVMAVSGGACAGEYQAMIDEALKP